MLILIFIFLSIAAADICSISSKPNVCCTDALNSQCASCSAQCTVAGDACTSTAGDCGAPQTCAGSLSAIPTLAQDTYSFTYNSGLQYLLNQGDASSFFDTTASSGLCEPLACKLVLDEFSLGSCDVSNELPDKYYTTVGENKLRVNTLYKLNVRVCLACSDSLSGGSTFLSPRFTLRTFMPDCSTAASLDIQPLYKFTDTEFITRIADGGDMVFPFYKDHSENNCEIASYLAVSDHATEILDSIIDSTAKIIQVRPNSAASGFGSYRRPFSIKVTLESGLVVDGPNSNGDTVFYYHAQHSCGHLHTLQIAEFIYTTPGFQNTQYVVAGDASATAFLLPTFIATCKYCTPYTYYMSTTDASVNPPANLALDDGVSPVTVSPSTVGTVTAYTFYIKILLAGASTVDFSGPYKLIVGACTPSEVTVSVSSWTDPSFSHTQYVPVSSNSSTFFVLPDATITSVGTPNPDGCEVTMLLISSSTGTYNAHSGFDDPIKQTDGTWTVAPSDLNLHQTLEFYLLAQIGTAGSSAYSSKLTLQVGCDSTETISNSHNYQTAQGVNANDDGAFTRFAMGLWQSSRTTCPVVAVKQSSSASKIEPIMALGDPGPEFIGDTRTLVAPMDIALETTYSFYVAVIFENSRVVFADSGLHKLVVGCTSSNTISEGALQTQKQVWENSDNMYTFPLQTFTVVDTNCPIEEVGASTTSGTFTAFAGLTPAADFSKITAPSTSDSLYEFYLFARAKGESKYFSAAKVELVIGCPPAYTSYSVNEQGYPSIAYSHNQKVESSQATTHFVFPEYSSSLRDCLLTSFRVSSSGSSFLSVPELQTPSNNGSNWIVAPTDPALEQKIEFYVEGTTSNGVVKLFTTKKTLFVGCPSSLSGLSISATYTGGLTNTQTVNINNEGGPTAFSFAIEASVAYCSVSSISISSTHGNQTAIPELDLASSTEVRPSLISTRASYNFYISASVGGSTKWVSDQQTLIVGCLTGDATAADSVSLVLSSSLDITGPRSSLYTFIAPTITSSNPTCTITSHELISIKIDGAPDATSSAVLFSCTQPCFTVEASNYTISRTLSFKVKSIINYGALEHISPEISVSLVCATASTTPAYSGPTNFTLWKDDAGPLELQAFSCSIPSCCSSLTYFITDDSSSKMSSHPDLGSPSLNLASKLVEVSVPTAAIKNYTFYYWAENSAGALASVGPLAVFVDYNCSIDSLALSTTAPTSDQASAIAPYGFYKLNSASAYIIDLRFEVGSLSSFSVDLSDRFTKTSPVGLCQFEKYVVSWVQEEGGLTVPEARWSSLFELSQDGILTIKQFNEPYDTLQLHISAFNSKLWSDPWKLGPLVTVSFSGEVTLPNIAPQFVGPLPDFELVIDSRNSTKIIYPLPGVYDANNDTFSVELQETWPFLSLPSASQLRVDPSTLVDTRNYSFSLLLEDSKGASQEYDLVLEVIIIEHPTHDEKQIKITSGKDTAGGVFALDEASEEKAGRSGTGVSAKIESIDEFGLVTIIFNQTIDTQNMDTSLLNSSVVKIYIDVTDRESDSPASLNLTWKLERFFLDTLTLQLTFDDLLEVSRMPEQDRLTIHFEEAARQLIFAPGANSALSKEFTTLRRRIPRQLPSTTTVKTTKVAFESLEVSLKVLIVVTFFLNYAMQGGSDFMLQLVRCLQVILHLPILRIVVPSNVATMFAIIVPVATFDVLDPDWTTKFAFSFDEEKQEALQEEVFSQIVDLGYETHNSLLNLGSLAIFTLIYFASLALYGAMVAFKKFSGRGPDLSAWGSSLLFGDLIAILLDAYFEFLISGYFQVRNSLATTGGEKFGSLFGKFGLVLILGFMPMVFAKVLRQPMETLSEPEFQERWGAAYDGVKLRSKWDVAYFVIFVIRRIAYVSIAFFISSNFEFQLLSLIVLNFMVFTYHGQVMPLATRLHNHIELFNEGAIAICSLNLLVFTDWVEQSSVQYSYGWVMVAAVAAMIAFNLGFVLYFGIRLLGLTLTRYYRIFRIKLEQRLSLHASPSFRAELINSSSSQAEIYSSKAESEVTESAIPATAEGDPLTIAAELPSHPVLKPESPLDKFMISRPSFTQAGDKKLKSTKGLKPSRSAQTTKKTKPSLNNDATLESMIGPAGEEITVFNFEGKFEKKPSFMYSDSTEGKRPKKKKSLKKAKTKKAKQAQESDGSSPLASKQSLSQTRAAYYTTTQSAQMAKVKKSQAKKRK